MAAIVRKNLERSPNARAATAGFLRSALEGVLARLGAEQRSPA